MKLTLLVLASAALAGAIALWIDSLHQKRSTARLIETLIDAPPAHVTRHVTFRALAGLPEPVARYLRHVLGDGQGQIEVARLRQIGELRTDVRSGRWLAFEATHTVAPESRGFVWDARVQLLPLVHFRVRDAYVDGHGSGRVSLLSAVPVASQEGRPEVDSGSLHRYLAEAVWYPTALLPSAALRWSAISNTKALATLTHAGITVSLEFWFNDAGEVTGIYSPGRWGTFGGEYTQVPWEGHFRNYHLTSGILVPREGEAGWYVADEWQCVWKGRIVDVRYERMR